MSDAIAVEQILAVLAEGQDGPAGPRSYYLDDGGGLDATLAALTAEEASRRIGGNSIAGQVEHILFSLRAFGTFIRGERITYDWNESWSVSEVDASAWNALRARVAPAFAELRSIIEEHAEKGVKPLGGSLAAITHLAYHLGAIRQKVTMLRA